MRIDPAYFNRFIAWTALLTAVIIVYSTVRYNQKQASDFEQTLSQLSFADIRFQDMQGDSLTLGEMTGGRPAVISFWSTWSEKSHQVNQFLQEYQKSHPEVMVIAASVRDDDTLIRNYIESQTFGFKYIDGTWFFQEHQFPGLPAQIFLRNDGAFYTTHIGNRTGNIDAILSRMNHE